MDNHTEALADDLPLFRYSLPVTVLLCVANAIVFVFGVVGNSCVVMVVCRSPKMRSPTNLFIANLACADLLINIICLPFTLISNIMSEWTMGWLMCKTIPYMQGVSVNASINTLVAISIERCFAICYPLRWQISSRASKRTIAAIWLFSLTIMLPWAVFYQMQPLYEGSPAQICREVWPTNYSGNVHFIVAILIMCYLLPLSVITACYLLIWRTAVFLRQPPGELRQSTDKIIQKSKVKVVKMLMTVIILFTFSWLPLYVIITRVKLGGPLNASEEVAVLMVIPFAQWLGTANSCINPMLYAYFNRNFRLGFKAIIYSRSCCTPLYYAPSGSDLRSVSSKQTLYKTNAKESVIRQFQNRKTKSCAVLYTQNLQCSNNSLNKIKPVLPKLPLGFRSVSVDNIYDKPVKSKCNDIFL